MKYGVAWAGSTQTSVDTVIASRPAIMLSGSFTWPFVPPSVSAPSVDVASPVTRAVVAVAAGVRRPSPVRGRWATRPSRVASHRVGGAGRSSRSASSSAWVTGSTVPWRGLAGSW